MAEEKLLFDAAWLDDAIRRLAAEIAGKFRGDVAPCEFALVGLHRRGVPLSERLADEIESLCQYRPLLGKLDISMYRDDFGLRSALPLIRETVLPFDLNDCRVVLVDDVLSSGRTIRAALDALTDYGRPRWIRLAVLIDRGGSEYPIAPDFTAMEYKISPDRKIIVDFAENGASGGVYEAAWRKES